MDHPFLVNYKFKNGHVGELLADFIGPPNL